MPVAVTNHLCTINAHKRSVFNRYWSRISLWGHTWGVCCHFKSISSDFIVNVHFLSTRSLPVYKSLTGTSVIRHSACDCVRLSHSFPTCRLSSLYRYRSYKPCILKWKFHHHLQVRLGGYSTRYRDANGASWGAGSNIIPVLWPIVVCMFWVVLIG